MADLEDILGIAGERPYPDGRRRLVRPAGADVSNSTIRYSSSNAGATNRHMCWSHPNPWAKSIGCPASTPESLTLFRATTLKRSA